MSTSFLLVIFNDCNKNSRFCLMWKNLDQGPLKEYKLKILVCQVTWVGADVSFLKEICLFFRTFGRMGAFDLLSLLFIV